MANAEKLGKKREEENNLLKKEVAELKPKTERMDVLEDANKRLKEDYKKMTDEHGILLGNYQALAKEKVELFLATL